MWFLRSKSADSLELVLICYENTKIWQKGVNYAMNLLNATPER